MDDSHRKDEMFNEFYIKCINVKILPLFTLKKQVFCLNSLECVTSNVERTLSLSKISDVSSFISLLTKHIVTHGIVNNFTLVEERDFCSTDFDGIPKDADICFSHVKLLLKYFEILKGKEKSNFLVYILILCASHNQKYLWSSEKSVGSSKDVLAEVLSLSKHKDVFSLLTDESYEPIIFRNVLLNLRPVLTKDLWQSNPSSCHLFYWFLTNMKHPFLDDYLQDILPPSLMFIDHHVIQHRVMGIKCIMHIIENVPPSSLRLNGKSDVVYDALSRLIYVRDLPVMEVLYPCLLNLLKLKNEKCNKLNWNGFDVVYHQLLLHLEMEESPSLKKVLSHHVNMYLENEKVPFKHLKHTLHVVAKSLPMYDNPEQFCTINFLQILKNLIKSCWPRMQEHCEEILQLILFFVYDLETGRVICNDKVNDEMRKLCEECILLLKESCSERFQEVIQDLDEVSDDIPGMNILKMSAITVQTRN